MSKQNNIDWYDCESSMCSEFGYNPATKDLMIKFRSGSLYAYHGVPRDVFTNMVNADSIGRFVNEEVVDYYNYTLIS